MKKINLLLTALFVLTASSAFAQDDTANFTASANIQASLAIAADGVTNLDFGDVLPGTANTVDATSGNALQYNITGANSSSFYISIPESIQLTGPGADEITFLFNVVGKDATDNSTGTSAVTSDGTANSGYTTNGTGEYYIWIGGSLHEDGQTANNIPTGIEAGAYTSAAATIEVGYDSF